MANYMKTAIVGAVLASFIFYTDIAYALARYECHDLTKDIVVLTPYSDNTINLSFDKDAPIATTKFTYQGDILTAEFKDADVQGSGSIWTFIINNSTKDGYEYISRPPKPAYAVEIKCYYFPK